MSRRSVTSGLLALLAVAALLSCDSEAVRRNAKLSRTHFLLGQDYLRKKNPEGAKQELLRAIKLNSENNEAHELLGVVFFLEGVHAMNHVDRRQCLTGAAAKEQRAMANGKFRRAEESLARAVSLSKKRGKLESDALNYLANIAIHFKRFDKAVALTTEALGSIVYGNRHMALGVRGWAYFKMGKVAPASRDLRQALFHRPGFCVARYRLAKVHYKRKQYKDAIRELVKVVEDKACAFQDPHHLLGLAYTKTRKPELAKAQFDRCVALNSKSCISLECRRYAKLIGQ